VDLANDLMRAKRTCKAIIYSYACFSRLLPKENIFDRLSNWHHVPGLADMSQAQAITVIGQMTTFKALLYLMQGREDSDGESSGHSRSDDRYWAFK
jgi:hypothetical protein